jgi:hypothetical protein
LGKTRRALRGAKRVATHPIWAELASPFARTTAWYVQSARGSPHRAGSAPSSAVPQVKPDLALAGQALVDEVVLTIIRLRHRARSAEEMARIEAEVADAVELYEQRGWLADPASYHRSPPPPYDARVRSARGPGADFDVLSFTSGYEPHADEPGRDRWLADEPNATAYAWLMRHAEPRPWIVCVHGAGMGQAYADLRVFRAQWLHHELGLNVALPIQARHGPRRAGAPFGIGWPGDDMLDNVHAIAQSVWDIRRVLAWIRREEPGATIALHGLSLGGYTTALVAGLEPDLACVIAGVPAIDFADLMDRHGSRRFNERPGYARISDMARRALRVVSPLAIPPRVPVERRFIYAGLADRLVHPQHQVHELWTQWEQPQINWFRGSHVGFFFSRPVQAFIVDALQRTGVIPPHVAA